MTSLVTGATGSLGSHLVEKLVAQGESVKVLARPGSRTQLLSSLSVEIVTGDLGEEDVLRKAMAAVDVVYHCAARVTERGSWAEFDECNIRGTERLLSAAGTVGVKRFVHVSSIGIYGPTQDNGGRVREENGYDPYPWRRGFYTWSKIEADRLALRFGRQNGLPTVVIRPGILYGPRFKPFVARLKVSLGEKLCLIVGSPHYPLPLAHVRSVVNALLLAGQGQGHSGEAYNVVDRPVTQKEYLLWLRDTGKCKAAVFYLPFSCAYRLAALLERVLSYVSRGQSRFYRYRLLRAGQDMVYDTSKAEQELGWRPAVIESRIGG